MSTGDFVWTDLSALQLDTAKAFYGHLFGWTYVSLTQPEGSAYEVASTPSGEAAAVFEMPEKFRSLSLPSFWMPYFSIDNVEAACDQATRAGGKVEMGPLSWSKHEQIALIRDPLGAGFTVYQGAGLSTYRDIEEAGRAVWRALYVSEVRAVRDFYAALFDWRISENASEDGGFLISTRAGAPVAEIHGLSDDIRGSYQFWGIHFWMPDVAAATVEAERNGGNITYAYDGSAGQMALVRDPDGAAFFIRGG